MPESGVPRSPQVPWTSPKLSWWAESDLGLLSLGSWWAVSEGGSPCSFTVFRERPDKQLWSLGHSKEGIEGEMHILKLPVCLWKRWFCLRATAASPGESRGVYTR